MLWVQWLLGQLVLPLIRAHFYCTESEAYKFKVFYFRWVLLTDETTAGCFHLERHDLACCPLHHAEACRQPQALDQRLPVLD